jgi:hypothetical protein
VSGHSKLDARGVARNVIVTADQGPQSFRQWIDDGLGPDIRRDDD